LKSKKKKERERRVWKKERFWKGECKSKEKTGYIHRKNDIRIDSNFINRILLDFLNLRMIAF